MELIYITNNIHIAQYAEKCNISRIMIDLEIIGKEKRQGHLNTVISKHSIDDILPIRNVLNKSKLLVRVNPINKSSEKEINEVLRFGADIIMLPMFTNPNEVCDFIAYVDERATVNLLLETPQALVRIDEILSIKGIDEIHIGLNDLHLGMGLTFMFELLGGGIIEYLSKKIVSAGIKFGFGGIARLDKGTLDSSLILSEHHRLNSTMVILSRDFHANSKNYEELLNNIDLKSEVEKIYKYLDYLKTLKQTEIINNQKKLINKISEIVKY